jgi:hypothetical protein
MIHGGFTGEIPLPPIAKTMPMLAPSSKTPPAASWLLRCISLHCLCLLYYCQHHICQLALLSASASCCVLFLSALASCCVVSRQPATLRPPPIASHPHGWLMCLLPAPSSLITVAWPLLTLCHCLPFCLSRASSQAGCCIASTHAPASHLPVSPPLIVPSPLVMPWPPIPLVQLVVLLPPSLILLACPSGWLSCCLCCSSSWSAPASQCTPASQRTTSTSHLLFAFCYHL